VPSNRTVHRVLAAITVVVVPWIDGCGHAAERATSSPEARVSSVVLLRAVNVGGHQRFQPTEVARRLADLGVVSVGAAGTFVVRADADEPTVRAAFTAALPFPTDPIVRDGAAVADLVDRDPLRDQRGDGVRAYVAALARVPEPLPPLPLDRPVDRPWEVRLHAVDAGFVLATARRPTAKALYPNEVVERVLGVPATTRGWETLVRVRALLG
jgi:uncharacterized protein (DUF1697 family)